MTKVLRNARCSGLYSCRREADKLACKPVVFLAGDVGDISSQLGQGNKLSGGDILAIPEQYAEKYTRSLAAR